VTKKNFFTIFLSLLVLFGSQCDLFALSNFYKRRFKSYDRNRNGTLDQNEYLAAMKVPQNSSARKNALRKFSALDANGDGFLQMGEFFGTPSKNTPIARSRTKGTAIPKTTNQPQPQASPSAEARMKYWGEDVSPQQPRTVTYPAAKDTGKKLYQGFVTNSFLALDQNRDGVIIPQEATRAYDLSVNLNKNKSEIQKMVNELFRLMDADQNGMITSEEYKQKFPKSFSF